jgi:flagellar basal-body rod protein FlgC
VTVGAFDALSMADSALGAHQTWLDALADNIANVNTYEPMTSSAFQAQYPIFQARPGGGVEVSGIATSDATGTVVSDPDSPLADKDGYVRAPDIDMASQMSQLIMAQRGYEASVQVTKTAQDTYDSAIQIGGK